MLLARISNRLWVWAQISQPWIYPWTSFYKIMGRVFKLRKEAEGLGKAQIWLGTVECRAQRQCLGVTQLLLAASYWGLPLGSIFWAWSVVVHFMERRVTNVENISRLRQRQSLPTYRQHSAYGPKDLHAWQTPLLCVHWAFHTYKAVNTDEVSKIYTSSWFQCLREPEFKSSRGQVLALAYQQDWPPCRQIRTFQSRCGKKRVLRGVLDSAKRAVAVAASNSHMPSKPDSAGSTYSTSWNIFRWGKSEYKRTTWDWEIPVFEHSFLRSFRFKFQLYAA